MFFSHYENESPTGLYLGRYWADTNVPLIGEPGYGFRPGSRLDLAVLDFRRDPAYNMLDVKLEVNDHGVVSTIWVAGVPPWKIHHAVTPDEALSLEMETREGGYTVFNSQKACVAANHPEVSQYMTRTLSRRDYNRILAAHNICSPTVSEAEPYVGAPLP